jgi:hypothetical protein
MPATGNAMLNDTRIRNAKPHERDYKLTDFDGLYLLECEREMMTLATLPAIGDRKAVRVFRCLPCQRIISVPLARD